MKTIWFLIMSLFNFAKNLLMDILALERQRLALEKAAMYPVATISPSGKITIHDGLDIEDYKIALRAVLEQMNGAKNEA